MAPIDRKVFSHHHTQIGLLLAGALDAYFTEVTDA